MTLVTRRFPDQYPEQWTATLTVDGGARVIELGPYKTLGRAMLIGLHVYHEWTMPPRLRRKYRQLLADPLLEDPLREDPLVEDPLLDDPRDDRK
jgi:hypothetical protein